MSPEPYVRYQALVAALLLVAACALGSPIVGLGVAVAGAAVAWGLKRKYRGDIRAASATIPPHRERLDRIVAGDAQAAFGVGLTAGALLFFFGVDVPDTGLAPATPLLLGATAATVYLSSLVDWYIILPRVSGLLEARPCRSHAGDFPSYPKTWRQTTGWWFGHRIVAAGILRFGVALAATLTLGKHLSVPWGASIVVGSVIGSALTAYTRAIPYAIQDAVHGSAIVGRTVHVREARRLRRHLFTVRGHTVSIPRFKRVPHGPRGDREYVYDVAIEGVEFVAVATRERGVPLGDEGEVEYERYPRKVRLRDFGACEPAEQEFSGCDQRCSGINWYCIENPRCFEPK